MPAKKRSFIQARCVFLGFVLLALSFSVPVYAAPDTVPPAAPQNFNATAVPSVKVFLAWSPSTDNVGVAGYNVYRRLSGGGNFEKLNSALVKGRSYDDKKVASGKNYEYVVRGLDAAGNVSADSNLAMAPDITLKETAVKTHVGKTVKDVMPGDAIEFVLEYTNAGYGFAAGVSIQHGIPKGTTYIASSARTKKGPAASILYLDKRSGKWVDKVDKAENVGKVKFILKDAVPAVAKGPNGIVSLKVIVGD